MPNDYGVRVWDYGATCRRRYGVTITDDRRTTTEVGTWEHRQIADQTATAIRKVIADAEQRGYDQMRSMDENEMLLMLKDAEPAIRQDAFDAAKAIAYKYAQAVHILGGRSIGERIADDIEQLKERDDAR